TTYLPRRITRSTDRTRVCNAGLRLVDLGCSQINRCPVIAIVDVQQHAARIHELVVGDRNVDDRAVDLRADRDGTRIDERVISGLVLPDVEPLDHASRDSSHAHDCGDAGDSGMPPTLRAPRAEVP